MDGKGKGPAGSRFVTLVTSAVRLRCERKGWRMGCGGWGAVEGPLRCSGGTMWCFVDGYQGETDRDKKSGCRGRFIHFVEVYAVCGSQKSY